MRQFQHWVEGYSKAQITSANKVKIVKKIAGEMISQVYMNKNIVFLFSRMLTSEK